MWRIVLLFIFLGLSGFFSASETALMSLSKIRIKCLIDEGTKKARLVDELTDNPSKLLGGILVGNNIVNIAASAIATSIAIDSFGAKGVTIATIVMTILILIFSEIAPKSLAANNSETIALKVARPISFVIKLFTPAITVLTRITELILKPFQKDIDPNMQQYITENELRAMIDVSHEEGVLESDEKDIIYNVFEFKDSKVKEVMTPRMNIQAVEVGASYEEIIEVFKEERFSRMPVYRQDIDNIIGILHIKDLVVVNKKEQFAIVNFIREPYYVYEFKNTSETFEDMRKNRVSMAVVLDEYGTTVGIVTIEDLVEEIVGEIIDEYDDIDDMVQVIHENEYIVDGSTDIDMVNEIIGINVESEEFDSIGGYIIGQFGRLPDVGERIEIANAEIIIESINKNRIEKLKIVM